MESKEVEGLGKTMNKLFEESRHRKRLLHDIEWSAAKRGTQELEELAHKIKTAQREDYKLKLVKEDEND